MLEYAGRKIYLIIVLLGQTYNSLVLPSLPRSGHSCLFQDMEPSAVPGASALFPSSLHGELRWTASPLSSPLAALHRFSHRNSPFSMPFLAVFGVARKYFVCCVCSSKDPSWLPKMSQAGVLLC